MTAGRGIDVLLTGAGGQLGREVARQAAAAGLAVHAAGRAGLDITDGAAVASTVARLGPRLVVNAAAYTAVDRAEDEPAAAFAANRDGPAHLARACARLGAPLVHVSTDYVFDGSKTAPTPRTTRSPRSGSTAPASWRGSRRCAAPSTGT